MKGGVTRAPVYNGPKNVSVDEVPDATIEKPTDALIRMTTTNICGSDLHMYEGRTDVEEGKVLGHKNMGEVIEVGAGVDRVKVGDHVVLPFNIGCGHCKNCEAGFTAFCLTASPFLLQGPVQGHRAGQRQAVQPRAAQPDPPRQAQPGRDRLARAEPRRRRRGLRQVR